uniref:SAM-dependent MTase RsmB/NOP-type domain-containing protein n=1 Tax=Rhodosorus marinus TaxID=101924 RepID=A0A7S3EJ34_9RHOD|mmetsp:Transcript_36633/g.146439  ORF Transcript_36633/g.146439 Transcript_36633/m.146439 type:complete len:623 (+) Transcript_36633:242-2110(+)
MTEGSTEKSGRRNRKRARGGDGRVALYGRPDGETQFIERSNEKFEEYYRRQKICSDDEFDKFMEELRVPLGTAFRVTSSTSVKDKIMDLVENKFTKLFNGIELEDGMVILAPKKLLWYPEGLAWSFNVPRPVLRKHEKLKEFQNFITQQNGIGAINRQEAVSMLPPLLLDLHPGQTVIDLCAAPGSKTAQILDALQSSIDSSRPSLIIANDSDLRRCNMLCHQLKRFKCADLLVTNHEAQHFPSCLSFDRVLCDVPCSGDGTLRKAPDMWVKWNHREAHGLHKLQMAIGRRGFDLLKPGGTMVYATCSFNPLENEAVVNSLLNAYGSIIELVDVSDKLKGFKRRDGLNTWSVKDTSPEQTWYTSFEQVPEHRRRSVVESMFPPAESAPTSSLLKRCVRVVPHDQDTGGFFVAVLRKAGEAPVVERVPTEGGARAPRQRPDTRNRRGYSNLLSSDPLARLNEVNPTLAKEIREFYGFEPEWVMNGVYSKSSEKQSKRLSFIPEKGQKVLDEFVYAPDLKQQLRVLSAGVRGFEKCPRDGAECSYRIAFDTLHILLPVLTRRVIYVKKETLCGLLQVSQSLLFDKVDDEETRKEIERISVGAVVFRKEVSPTSTSESRISTQKP